MHGRALHAWLSAAIILGAGLFSGDSRAEEFIQRIPVRQNGNEWLIEGRLHRVAIDASTLKMTITDGSATWPLRPPGEKDLKIAAGGTESETGLLTAKEIELTEYATGYKTGVLIRLARFGQPGTGEDLELKFFVCLEGPDEDVVFDIVARETGATIKGLLWPKGFDDTAYDHTVVPYMQGMLLPKAWPEKVRLYNTVTYGRGLYMPWWGHQQGNAAAMVILETPDDAGCNFEHPAGGPTFIEPRWMHSLGALRYPRRLRMSFFREGNYVDLAKRYRKHVIDTGHFVSLGEKIARTPLLAKLIGSPVVHTGILTHIQPASSYYDKQNPAKNHQYTSFYERAGDLRKLYEQGIEKAYVHLDGWGYRGYDNLHPDILPPSPEAGGWEGMKYFGDVCDSIGYVFAVHDQYRDYYHDAASYNERHTIIMEDGKRPFGNTWFGGDQSVLCPSLAPGHVMKNHNEIHAHGVKLRGAYLDVFAVVPPEECYNPEHPITRTECLAYRGDCLDFIRSLGGVVSSEEPADWAIPYIDLVHHGPYALDPNPGKGPAIGIPVPLFNLVYHDALLLPWSLGKGGWGIPETDLGFLHALMNAGMPYLSLKPKDAELERVRTLCRLHGRVGMLEMVKHEFIDGNYRKQRTVFSDGTTITVDFDTDEFDVEPGV